MYSSPNFFDYLRRDLLVTAAKNDEDYVMVDGSLKKGKWATMPNGIHVFIVAGKIEAGPDSTVGKSPDELDWDKIHKEHNGHHEYGGSKGTPDVRPDVKDKYAEHMSNAGQIKDPVKREGEMDRIFAKMVSEDNFHAVFMNTSGKPSPALKELTKAFADYGSFPIQGKHKDQVIWYQDRIALLGELATIVPKDTRKTINIKIDTLKMHVESMKKHGPIPPTHPVPVNPSVLVHAPNQPLNQSQPSNMKTVSPSPFNGNGGKSNPPPNNNGGTPPRPVPNNNSTQKPLFSSNQPTQVPNKNPRAKTRAHLTLESLLRGAFNLCINSIAYALHSATKKSDAWENKILYKVTKRILSNTNINERDKFFDVVRKSFAT